MKWFGDGAGHITSSALFLICTKEPAPMPYSRTHIRCAQRPLYCAIYKSHRVLDSSFIKVWIWYTNKGARVCERRGGGGGSSVAAATAVRAAQREITRGDAGFLSNIQRDTWLIPCELFPSLQIQTRERELCNRFGPAAAPAAYLRFSIYKLHREYRRDFSPRAWERESERASADGEIERIDFAVAHSH